MITADAFSASHHWYLLYCQPSVAVARDLELEVAFRPWPFPAGIQIVQVSDRPSCGDLRRPERSYTPISPASAVPSTSRRHHVGARCKRPSPLGIQVGRQFGTVRLGKTTSRRVPRSEVFLKRMFPKIIQRGADGFLRRRMKLAQNLLCGSGNKN